MMSEIEKYVEVIFENISNKSELEEILFDLSVMSEKIGYSTVVQGSDDRSDRKAIISDALPGISSEILKEYFTSLVEKGDLWIFEPGHFKTFLDELKAAASKIIYFYLSSAVDLKKEDIRSLTDKISRKMERKVIIEITVDSSIIGGAIIKKDNYIFDFSVKSKLNSLCDQWKKSLEEAPQSGTA